MTKISDSVVPKSRLSVRMPPGSPTPRSGIYEKVEPRVGMTDEQADSTRGKLLPPMTKPGRGWTLVDPAKHNSGK